MKWRKMGHFESREIVLRQLPQVRIAGKGCTPLLNREYVVEDRRPDGYKASF
jgi:hypothetical protein